MNEQDVMKAVRKVLKADDLIHEQILGLQYVPPVQSDGTPVDIDSITSSQIFHMEDTSLPFTVRPLLGGTQSSTAPATTTGSAGAVTSTQKQQPPSTPDTNTPATGTENAPNPSTAASMVESKHARFSNEQVRQVLDLLSTNAPFLVDSRVTDSATVLPPDEASLYKIDTVLSALGIDDREDLDQLVALFFEKETDASPYPHPNDVVKIVRDFVKRHNSKAQSGSAASMKNAVSAERAARRAEQERQFWNRLGSVVPDRTWRVWGALEQGLRKYNTLLEDRHKLIDETTVLARQNEELKILLQEYLSSKINTELHVSPTRLIRVDH